MIVAFSIGSKCAVMLPRKYLNLYLTPAKGLIINRLVDRRSLVLVEEVWQFKGLSHAPLAELCFSRGGIKQVNWGWQELPQLMSEDEYLIVPAHPHNLMEPEEAVLDAMVRKSIQDFQKINGFI